MLRKVAVGVLVVFIVAVAGIQVMTGIDIISTFSAKSGPVEGVPETSACAVTQPPPSMDGIDTHIDVFGTPADPDMITLGPKTGIQSWSPYPGKTSVEFELEHGTPVLAPIDMVFVGFKNRNAERRTLVDGEVQSPYDDLLLCFESASPDWPGMIISVYHLSTSPLLVGHIEGSECYRMEEFRDKEQGQGRIYYETEDVIMKASGGAEKCEPLMGRLVKRGEVIGYAGSVGDHSMAPFRFKVQDTTVNPTVRVGNKHLHWVQPDSFFYWKCYSPDADYPSGVLAYPFVCEAYDLPSEQVDVSFKYTRTQN